MEKKNYVHGYSSREGARLVDQAMALGMIDRDTWQRGIEALYRAAEEDGTFCYTFFKATGINSP